MMRLVSDNGDAPVFRRDATRPAPDPANRIFTQVFDYWERLRHGRLAPARAKIDPRELTGALDNVLILEERGENDIAFRFAGRLLTAFMGMELRAMPARSIITPASRSEFETILKDVLQKPKVVEMRFEAESTSKSKATARLLLLPMYNRRGEMNRILGCMIVNGGGFTPPLRFTLKDYSTTRIVAQAGEEVSAAPESPEPAKPFRPDTIGQRPKTQRLSGERAYLKLVR